MSQNDDDDEFKSRVLMTLATDVRDMAEIAERVHVQFGVISDQGNVVGFPGARRRAVAAAAPVARSALTHPVVMIINWSVTIYALLFPSLSSLLHVFL